MNRDEHNAGGVISGIIFSFIIGDIVMMLPCIFFSYIGSRLPDVIEPPTWPGHRGLFHSAVGMASLAMAMLRSAPLGFIGALLWGLRLTFS